MKWNVLERDWLSVRQSKQKVSCHAGRKLQLANSSEIKGMKLDLLEEEDWKKKKQNWDNQHK